MKQHVLDTDMLTLYQESHPKVVFCVNQRPRQEVAISVISVEEQLSGWYTRLRRAKQRDELARVYERLTTNVRSFEQFRILSFDEASIARYEGLKKQKLGVGKMDLRIAAIVLQHDGVLVTRNLRDFQRVPDLAIEDWSA